MSETDASENWASRPGAGWIHFAITAVVAIFLGLYWINLTRELDKNEADAMAAVERHAVFSAYSAAETVEIVLDRFRISLRIAAIAALEGPKALALYGDAVSSGVDEMVYQLFFIDRDGYLAYSSLGPSPRNFLGDRDYFQALAADPRTPFVVTPPVLGRLTGKWSIQIAHAVWADGKFIGVVAIAVSPEQWTARLSKFEDGPNHVLTLLSAQGVYLLRTRAPSQSYGQKVPADRPFLRPDGGESGTYVEPGALDGVIRLYGWKRLPTGQVLASGVALDEAMAATREINRLALLRGGSATTALLVAVAAIILLIRRFEQASRATVQKEYLQRVTLSVMAEGLAVVSPDGRISFHNDSFARILPYTGDRLIRNGPFLAWDVVDSQGNPLAQADFPSTITARTGQPFDNVTLGIRMADRKTRWLNVNTRPLRGEGGKPDAAILTMTDITSEREVASALKESEERHRTVVESLVEGITVQDRDGFIIASNPAAERILGLGRDNAAGRGLADPRWRTIHPDGSEFPAEDHPAMLTLATGERKEGIVMGLRKPDGTAIWLEINTAPLWGGEAARPVAAVSSLLDITNRKEFEDELSRSNAELEQFAYAVSHDLREPLRMVASYIQLLQRRLGPALTEETLEFIGYAVDGAKRMDRMLVALLEYSRVGRIGQPMEWIDSRQSLQEALLFLSPAIEQNAARIAITGEWPEILASADEFERLFQNLLGNALKYHAEGTVPVIEVCAQPDNTGWEFSFRDNGIGIAPDQIGRLFKVFQRLHANDRFEGSGVGLALCRRIVQRHDGRIWVESQGADTGSTFFFTLPASHVRVPAATIGRTKGVASDGATG